MRVSSVDDQRLVQIGRVSALVMLKQIVAQAQVLRSLNLVIVKAQVEAPLQKEALVDQEEIVRPLRKARPQRVALQAEALLVGLVVVPVVGTTEVLPQKVLPPQVEVAEVLVALGHGNNYSFMATHQ